MGPDGKHPEMLVTENETNSIKLWEGESYTTYFRDAFHRYVVNGRVNKIEITFKVLITSGLFSSSEVGKYNGKYLKKACASRVSGQFFGSIIYVYRSHRGSFFVQESGSTHRFHRFPVRKKDEKTFILCRGKRRSESARSGHKSSSALCADSSPWWLYIHSGSTLCNRWEARGDVWIQLY